LGAGRRARKIQSSLTLQTIAQFNPAVPLTQALPERRLLNRTMPAMVLMLLFNSDGKISQAWVDEVLK